MKSEKQINTKWNKIRKSLHREVTPKKFYLLLVVAITLLLVIGYTSYAILSVTLEKQNTLNIVTGSLNTAMKVDGAEEMEEASGEIQETRGKYVVSVEADTVKSVTVTLQNINAIDARFLLYYLGTLPEGVKVGYQANTSVPPVADGIDLGKYQSGNDTSTYRIVIQNDSDHKVSITLGNSVGLAGKQLDPPEMATFFTEVLDGNPGATLLRAKANAIGTSYLDGVQGELYAFTSNRGAQQEAYSNEAMTEYRYLGSNPANYVNFNDEIWRIVGIFSVEDRYGTVEPRIKLVRESAIGNYAWNQVQGDVSPENDWTNATLMKVLNPGYDAEAETASLYWNQGSGTCALGNGNAVVSTCDFSNIGLLEEARNLVGDAKWYLGSASTTSHMSAEAYLAIERGTLVYESETTRQINWIGKVGLLYPSDYAYTYAGVDSCFDAIDTCNATSLANSWLGSTIDEWLLTPFTGSSTGGLARSQTGTIQEDISVTTALAVRPSVYLRSDVKVVGGTGTADDPYRFR